MKLRVGKEQVGSVGKLARESEPVVRVETWMQPVCVKFMVKVAVDHVAQFARQTEKCRCRYDRLRVGVSGD
jgi:hypothetical protein